MLNITPKRIRKKTLDVYPKNRLTHRCILTRVLYYIQMEYTPYQIIQITEEQNFVDIGPPVSITPLRYRNKKQTNSTVETMHRKHLPKEVKKYIYDTFFQEYYSIFKGTKKNPTSLLVHVFTYLTQIECNSTITVYQMDSFIRNVRNRNRRKIF